MRLIKLLVLMAVLIVTVGALTVSAEETTTTVVTVKDLIPTETAGDVPQTVKNLLKQQSYIAPTERLNTLDILTIREACNDLMKKSFDGRVEVPTNTKDQYDLLKTFETVDCTENYIYACHTAENGVTTEFVFYFDGTVVKTVGYELNGVRYAAFNDDNRVIMMEGTPSAQVNGRESTSINISDVLFGFVIAVVLVMIIAAIVITKKKVSDR